MVSVLNLHSPNDWKLAKKKKRDERDFRVINSSTGSGHILGDVEGGEWDDEYEEKKNDGTFQLMYILWIYLQ